MADLIAIYRGRLETIPGNFRKKAFAATRGPSADDRRRLEAHRTTLRRRLAPGGDNNRAAAAKMLNAWPSYGSDARATAASVLSIVEVIGKFPTWAVEEAVTRFRNSTAVTKYDRGKAPTQPNMADEIRAITGPLDVELADVDSILGAEIYQPITDEERAKLDAAVSAWADERAMLAASERPSLSPQEFDARLRERGSLDGLRLSFTQTEDEEVTS